MKNKALKAEIEKHIEGLTRALRSYTDEPMYLSLCIFTRDEECRHDDDPDSLPDYYSVTTYQAELVGVDDADVTFAKAARVFYSYDGNDELIRTVKPYYDEGIDDEV